MHEDAQIQRQPKFWTFNAKDQKLEALPVRAQRVCWSCQGKKMCNPVQWMQGEPWKRQSEAKLAAKLSLRTLRSTMSSHRTAWWKKKAKGQGELLAWQCRHICSKDIKQSFQKIIPHIYISTTASMSTHFTSCFSSVSNSVFLMCREKSKCTQSARVNM